MFSSKFSIFPLACCVGIPLLADVIPLTISQQVSVSGSASVCVTGCLDILSQSFGPTGQTNTFLPPTNLSVTGSVTESIPYGNYATSNADASQSPTITANSIQGSAREF